MNLSFSDLPGARERQLIRRHQNPLFGAYNTVNPKDLDNARSDDALERDQFYREFQQVLQEIADLTGEVDSEKILAMKQRVDQMYEQCAGLAGDNQGAIDGLARLQKMIMEAISQGAAGDETASRELKQEAVARELHQELLQHKLICDLLRPDSLIGQEQLAATMLSEDLESVQAALILFQPRPLQALIDACEKLLAGMEDDSEQVANARRNLDIFKDAIVVRRESEQP